MINDKQVDDLELIYNILKGGREMNAAIDRFISLYKSEMVGYFKKIGSNEENAKEIFYEGMSVLIINVRSNKFRGESSIKTYLYAICKNLWRKSIRSDRLRADYIESEKTRIRSDFLSAQEVNVIDDNLKGLLRDLMKLLKTKCDEVLSLWALHYSMKEIASHMNYANSQVAMNKKNKCMRQLSKLVADSPALRQELYNEIF